MKVTYQYMLANTCREPSTKLAPSVSASHRIFPFRDPLTYIVLVDFVFVDFFPPNKMKTSGIELR